MCEVVGGDSGSGQDPEAFKQISNMVILLGADWEFGGIELVICVFVKQCVLPCRAAVWESNFIS